MVAKKEKIEKICNECWITYFVHPYREKSKYCSKKCLNKSKIWKPTWIKWTKWLVKAWNKWLKYTEEQKARLNMEWLKLAPLWNKWRNLTDKEKDRLNMEWLKKWQWRNKWIKNYNIREDKNHNWKWWIWGYKRKRIEYIEIKEKVLKRDWIKCMFKWCYNTTGFMRTSY